MSVDSLADAVKDLSRPFTNAAIRMKPQTVTKGEPKKGLVTYYIDSRLVVARLNHVVGPAKWSDEYDLLSLDPKTGLPVECRLTIMGVTKADVGQIEPGAFDNKAFKSSYSDALKRAAVKFGLGAFLYQLPNVWVPMYVDPAGKATKFSDEGVAAALGAYRSWIKSDRNHYGDPLDHGDVLDQVGDTELAEEAETQTQTGVALLPDAPRGAELWPSVAAMQERIGPDLDWKAIGSDLMYARYGVSTRAELQEGEWEDYATRFVNAVTELNRGMDAGDFPPMALEQIGEAFARWFDGVLPTLVPSADMQAERDADKNADAKGGADAQ